ncbi:MAG: ribosome biogenesis GTPase Der [Steroidobacteraceae bacterium]
MIPVVALVGRPNVGKSTLFNVLTRTRDAIVSDVPGVTRDRQYGFGRAGEFTFIVIDTGGLVENPTGLDAQMRAQTERAVAEADRLILITDARSGLTPQDQLIARELRRSGKPITLAVNKAEGLDDDVAGAEFHRLGIGEPQAIAASHGAGCRELIEIALAGLLAEDSSATPDGIGPQGAGQYAAHATQAPGSAIRIAIVGRPNVGKSTLVNRLLGEERVIASEQPGTTRDSILVPFRRDERDFLLIDTAGMRRRARIEDPIERVSVAKTLQAIDEAHVVVLVVDAHDTITEQDASVLGVALGRGRALLVAVNKWDGIPPEQRETIHRQLGLRLDFASFVPLHFISARHGTGVGELVQAAARAYDGAMRDMPTPALTRTLERAIAAQSPPIVRGRRIKLKFAHQGGRNPPRIVVHGNQTTDVPAAYRRYLSNVFRKAFDLFASPVVMEFRTDANPYSGRTRPGSRGSRPGKAGPRGGLKGRGTARDRRTSR